MVLSRIHSPSPRPCPEAVGAAGLPRARRRAVGAVERRWAWPGEERHLERAGSCCAALRCLSTALRSLQSCALRVLRGSIHPQNGISRVGRDPRRSLSPAQTQPYVWEQYPNAPWTLAAWGRARCPGEPVRAAALWWRNLINLTWPAPNAAPWRPLGPCPCHHWNRMIFKVPSNLRHSVILWFHPFLRDCSTASHPPVCTYVQGCPLPGSETG